MLVRQRAARSYRIQHFASPSVQRRTSGVAHAPLPEGRPVCGAVPRPSLLGRLMRRTATKRPALPPQVPEALCCPITQQLFRDPVMNSLGNTYERAALLRAWAGPPGARRDPLTNEAVPDTRLVPNQDKRRQVLSRAVRARVTRAPDAGRARVR